MNYLQKCMSVFDFLVDLKLQEMNSLAASLQGGHGKDTCMDRLYGCNYCNVTGLN